MAVDTCIHRDWFEGTRQSFLLRSDIAMARLTGEVGIDYMSPMRIENGFRYPVDSPPGDFLLVVDEATEFPHLGTRGFCCGMAACANSETRTP